VGKGESAADGRAQVETALDVAEKCSTTIVVRGSIEGSNADTDSVDDASSRDGSGDG
jgi:hypothetical protein